jgi:hypothetical protein
MRYIVGAMMVIFFLSGVVLLWQAGKLLLQTIQRRPHLLRVYGQIQRVERHRNMSQPRGHHRPQWSFYPVILFAHQNGKTVSFTSSTGDMGSESRYKTGQILPVLYDPANIMPPMINRGLSIFLWPLLLGFCGFMFGGASLVIWTLFGDKILGG